MDEFVQFLSSVRFGIYLLIVLVLISFVGTIIPQKPNTSPDKLQQMFAPPNLLLLDHLGILDIFHAWWFKALLTLLGLNIVFASMDRFSTAWRYLKRPAKWLTETVIRAQHQHADVELHLTLEEGQKRVEKTLTKFIGHPQLSEREGRKVFFAQRHVYSRLAAYGIHLSLLVIFAGGLIGLQFGYRGQLTLNEGDETSSVVLFDTSHSLADAAAGPKIIQREMPFTLRLDKAEVVFNDPKEASLLRREDIQSPGVVKNWYCTLSIWENGVKRGTHVVAVNQPLSYRGYRFFQTGFDYGDGFKQMTFKVQTKDTSGAIHESMITVRKGEHLQIKELGISAAIERAGVMPQADIPFVVLSVPEPAGKPALQIPVFDEATTQRMRQGSGDKLMDARLPGGAEVFLMDAVPEFATTLQVSRDPGVTTVWIGCVMLMVGLMIAFYFSHQRVWAMLIPTTQENRTTVVIGGDSNKNRSGFAAKFERLVKALQAEDASPREN